MKKLLIALCVVGFGVTGFSKADSGADKKLLTDKMTKACKTELAKEPALDGTQDGEAIWKNLEDKEHSKVKLSKNCDNAHEAYEAKYHKGDKAEESEKH